MSESHHYIINCDNIFSKERGTQELIFKEEGLFEIFENKSPSKITWYTVSKVVGISTSYPLKSPSTEWSWITID